MLHSDCTRVAIVSIDSDTIDRIATIAAETLLYPSRDRSDRIATIAEA